MFWQPPQSTAHARCPIHRAVLPRDGWETDDTRSGSAFDAIRRLMRSNELKHCLAPAIYMHPRAVSYTVAAPRTKYDRKVFALRVLLCRRSNSSLSPPT
jgi:hypothetical protein